MRTGYHRYKKSTHHPAPYEFPISVWRMKRLLRRLGFTTVVYPQSAYPGISPWQYRLYKHLARRSLFLHKYLNYHYLLSGTKLK
ncbi:MAG: hypothetical protein HY984_00795 [Candidatus Magasanikbacteria bacterium]|nr:hypothetical protein [Candidatus Magasanikbacteria bacterium]